MTKADLANEIAHRTKVNKHDARKVIETFMEMVKESLVEGESVYLREFGTFTIKYRAEKPAQDITRRRTIIVPARNIPAFKPSKAFTEMVKANSKIPVGF